jgi:hypothetical protein
VKKIQFEKLDAGKQEDIIAASNLTGREMT